MRRIKCVISQTSTELIMGDRSITVDGTYRPKFFGTSVRDQVIRFLGIGTAIRIRGMQRQLRHQPASNVTRTMHVQMSAFQYAAVRKLICPIRPRVTVTPRQQMALTH